MAIISKLVALLGIDQRDFDKNLDKSIKTLDKAAAKMETIGKKLTTRVTAPIVAVGAISVKAFSDFDSALTKSTAIMSDATGRLGDMEEAALNVARTTTFSAAEAAEAFFFLASAGLDAEQSIGALPQVAQFAQAGMFDLATATDLLTDAQSALGLTSKDTQENLENMRAVSDVLVKANTIANASVQQFSESLTNQGAAAARFAKVEMEEAVAVLAAFADQGVKGADAGTKLAILLRDLTTKAATNAEEFERFGITVFDSAGNLESISRIIQQLESRLGSLGVEQQKLNLLQLGFSDRSVGVIQSLLGMSQKISDYEKELRMAGGTTERVAQKQLKAFAAQMKLLRNQIVEVFISIGKELVPVIQEELVPIIQSAIEGISDAVEWFSGLNDTVKKVILGVVGFVAAIGPLTLALAGLLTATSAVAGVLGGPAWALILVGGGLITGLTVFAEKMLITEAAAEAFRGEMVGASDAMKEAAKAGRTLEEQLIKIEQRQIQQKMHELNVQLTALKETIKAGQRPESLLTDMRIQAIATQDQVERLAQRLTELGQMGAPSVSGGIGEEDIQTPDASAFTPLLDGLSKIGEQATTVFDGLKEVGSQAFTAIGETIEGVVVTAEERLAMFYEDIAQRQEAFRQQVNDAWMNWLAVGTDVVTNLKAATLDFLDSFTSGFGDALAQVIVFQKDFEETMMAFLKNLLAQIISTLAKIVVQWLISSLIQAAIGESLHSTRVAQALQLIYLNSFSAAAATPVVGPYIAGGVAAGAVAEASLGSLAAAGTGKAVAAAASVPVGLDTGGLILDDGIARLHEGERVLTAQEVRTMPNMGSGMMMVTVELDGRILTQKIVQRVPHELRMRGI